MVIGDRINNQHSKQKWHGKHFLTVDFKRLIKWFQKIGGLIFCRSGINRIK